MQMKLKDKSFYVSCKLDEPEIFPNRAGMALIGNFEASSAGALGKAAGVFVPSISNDLGKGSQQKGLEEESKCQVLPQPQ